MQKIYLSEAVVIGMPFKTKVNLFEVFSKGRKFSYTLEKAEAKPKKIGSNSQVLKQLTIFLSDIHSQNVCIIIPSIMVEVQLRQRHLVHSVLFIRNAAKLRLVPFLNFFEILHSFVP